MCQLIVIIDLFWMLVMGISSQLNQRVVHKQISTPFIIFLFVYLSICCILWEICIDEILVVDFGIEFLSKCTSCWTCPFLRNSIDVSLKNIWRYLLWYSCSWFTMYTRPINIVRVEHPYLIIMIHRVDIFEGLSTYKAIIWVNFYNNVIFSALCPDNLVSIP